VIGLSSTTSLAGLSCRRPLNEAWRIIPDAVHPANSISATKVGLSHRIPCPSAGELMPLKGLALRVSFCKVGRSLLARAAP